MVNTDIVQKKLSTLLSRIKAVSRPFLGRVQAEFSGYASIFIKIRGELLSLDVGTHSLKLALVSVSPGRAELLRYDMRELTPQESPTDATLLGGFITTFIGDIKTRNIIVSFQNPDSLVIKRIDLPSVPEKELYEAIKWEVKDEIPFELDQLYLDWQLIGEYTDKDGAKRQDIVIACVKKDIVDRYVKTLRDAGFSVVDFKLPPFNISYILQKLEGAKKDVVPVLDVGAANSLFSLYKNGHLSFVRNLPFSSEQLTMSMSGTFTSDQGRMELTKDKAEEIKRTFGIPQSAEALQEGITGSQIMALMRPPLERLRSEITRSIDYYTVNYEAPAPQFLYVTGGGSNLKGLHEYLRSELRFNVEALPLPNTVTIGAAVDKEKFNTDRAQLMSAIGAALGVNKRPNLLPGEYKAERLESLQKVSLRLAGITIGIALLFSFVGLRAEVADYKKRLQRAGLHLQTIGTIHTLYDRTAQRQAVVARAQASVIPADWVMKELGNLMPASIVLTGLGLDQTKNNLTLGGYVVVREQNVVDELTSFMKALKASPLFTEATLRFSDSARYEGRDAAQFEIRCTLLQ
jgi:type IV pilus assembly protein PilM